MHAAERETIHAVPSYCSCCNHQTAARPAAEDPDQQAAAQAHAAGAERQRDHEAEQDRLAEALAGDLADPEHGKGRRDAAATSRSRRRDHRAPGARPVS